MNTSAPRYKRGDCHPSIAGFVFLRYDGRNGLKECWTSIDKLNQYKSNAKVTDKQWKQTSRGRKYMTDYLRKYLRRPDQKARMSNYYKQPEVRARYRQKYAENPEYFRKLQTTPAARISQLKSRKKNAVKIRIRAREYQRKKRQTIIEKIKRNCQQTMQRALKARGVTKSMKTNEMLRCTYEFFQGWIERQFLPGMTWENRGIWECDHCIPIARFDLSDPKQVKIAFGYENCRPIWKEDNRLKSDFIQHNGKQVRARELRKIVPFVQAA